MKEDTIATVRKGGSTRIFKTGLYRYSIEWILLQSYSGFVPYFFFGLSMYLLCCTKKTSVFYLQIAAGCGIFLTSKIGRKFLGLE